MNENKLIKDTLAIRNEAVEMPDPEGRERFQVKIIEGVPVIRDSHTEFIYRLHVPSETFALVHLVNELIKPTKKPRKRKKSKARPDKFHPADVAIIGGDPSL